MVPFYTFYSMFGFQRVGDLIWQAADARTRGFLLGATAGRTTLLGEGLQHQDGHSLVLPAPCRRARPTTRRSPTRSAAIVQAGLHRMYGGGQRATPTSSTTSPSTTRTTRCRRCPRRPASRADDHARPVPLAARARRARQARPRCCSRGSAHGAAREAAAELRRALRRRRRAVVGHVVQGAARGRARRSSAGTACTPARSRAAPLVAAAARRRARARSSPSPTS